MEKTELTYQDFETYLPQYDFDEKQKQFFKETFEIIMHNRDTSKVTCFADRPGIGKSTLIKALMHCCIGYDAFKGQYEPIGLIVITDSMKRLEGLSDGKKDRIEAEECWGELFEDWGIKYHYKEFEKSVIVLKSDVPFLEQLQKQYYKPIILMSTQRYFMLSKKVRDQLFTFSYKGEVYKRNIVIFDECPYFSEIVQINSYNLAMIEAALLEGLSDEVEDKEFVTREFSVFKNRLIDQMAKNEKEIENSDVILYWKDERYPTITPNDTLFFKVVEDNMESLTQKYSAILKDLESLREMAQNGAIFYCFKKKRGNNYERSFVLVALMLELINQMTNAVGSGKVRKGADEWLEMVNALSNVDGSILDCKKSIEEFDNSILELHTEIFNRIQEQFANLDSEISNILDLFNEFDVSDDKGIWSKEAIAQLGLLTQQYELAQYQIEQYNSEIDELNKQYLAGKYSATEYADKLADLSSAQWDAVKASESAKDAIMDLNETRIENQIEGIEKEIDAYKELTDAQIEALKASKDLHEYENSIADKTKSITDLERQIAAMQNDSSAATVAKRKQLEDQLAQAKKDLEETEYQHSIEVQEDALNKQYEDYEKTRNEEIDALRESLNDRETMLAQSFETVKANASLVGQEITWIAAQHGISVSNALISSWQSGEQAIASYGEILSQGTSAFIGNIIGVENEVWNLQAQANTTADSLAWMFSTKADTLVNELTASYYCEENFQTMTLALQDSLINTLERGYDVSSIVNAIDSISESAGRAKASIDDLLGSLETEIKGGGTSNSSYDPLVKKVTFVPSFKQYASGTRSTKGNIFVKDEEGYELQFDKLSSGRYAVANEGSQIFKKEDTDNLYKWSKIDPTQWTRLNAMDKMWNNAGTIEPMVNKTVNNNTPVTIHYDSIVTVNGDVNDTNHFIKQVQAVAHNEVANYSRDINNKIKNINNMKNLDYKHKI